MKVVIAGDFCDRYRVSENIKKQEYGKLFDEIKTEINKADYSIVNFEFPIVSDEKQSMPIHKAGPNLRGTLKSVNAVKYAGFQCCTLANNHILDQGSHCCVDTLNHLNKAGIDTVGVGRNLSAASSILYKTLGEKTLAIINCCEHEFSQATTNTVGACPLNPIIQYHKITEAKSNADYVLIIIHGGHEHYQLPSTRMQETYRFFVDCGADAVVNHHQHCFSGYEIYRGKPIFYGIGNFCFDEPSKRDDIWNEGYLVALDFSDEITYKIIPYKQNNDTVGVNLMNEKESALFNSKLEELNRIIANTERLLEEQKNYFNKDVKSELFMFEPWRGGLMYKLYLKGFLPSMVKKRITFFLNRFACESHRDKMIHILSKLNSK